jgi:hypothetical protein
MSLLEFSYVLTLNALPVSTGGVFFRSALGVPYCLINSVNWMMHFVNTDVITKFGFKQGYIVSTVVSTETD